jgi:hypothetical protein
MVLRLSHLKSCIQKDYIKEYFDKGLKSLLKVYLKLVKPIDSATKPHRQRTRSSTDTDASSLLSDLFAEDDENEDHVIKTSLLIREERFKSEIEKLREILIENKYSIKINNCEFWRKYERHLPELYKLAIILCNIQSSAAFIERFFSICGVVCKKRAANMKNKLIIMRSIMKANIHILDQLNQGYY